MAEPTAPVETVAPASESAVPAAPVAAPAPASVETPTPAAVPAPAAAEPAPAVTPETPATIAAEKPAAEAKPATAGTEPVSLLSEAAPAPEPKPEAKTDAKAETKPQEGEAKPGDAPKEGEAPATEEARAEQAPLPTYDPFTVPEGVELDDPQVDRFIGTVAAFERDINPTGDPKVHSAVQGLIQNLADQYTDEISTLGDRIAQANAETFNRTMENWKEQFFSDPEIGGNRKDTTIRAAGGVISRFGGTPQQVAELKQVLSSTGAGNSIHLIRLFNNIAAFHGEGQPVPGVKPEPQQQTRQERRYGQKRN